MFYRVVALQPHDIPAMGTKKGARSIIHVADRVVCERMVAAISAERRHLYVIEPV